MEEEREFNGGMNRRREGLMRKKVEENKSRKRNEVGRGRRKRKSLGLEVEEGERKKRE